MVDAAQGKESRAKETITQLREEISNLSKLVEKGAKLSGGQALRRRRGRRRACAAGRARRRSSCFGRAMEVMSC